MILERRKTLNKNTSVWTLQLVKYFMFSKDYLQIGIVNDLTQLISKDQYWLVNKDNKDYPIIHISDFTDQIRDNNQPIIEETVNKIVELVGINQVKVLDISLNSEASDACFDTIDYIQLHPNKELPESVTKAFPQLNKVIYDVTDPQSELKKLDKELTQLFVSKQKALRKKINRDRFKENVCVTFLVPCIICVLMWAVVNLSAYILDTDAINTAIFLGAYYKAFITIFHQFFRLFTGGFIHLGILHLLCNMIALFDIGKEVEKNYSSNKALIILCSSIIIGNLFVYIADKNIVAVGISGGIYGLFGALLVAYVNNGYFKIPQFRDKFIRNLYVNIIINFLPNVSYLAHLGGFVCGVILALLFSKSTSKFFKINIVICTVILVAVLVYMAACNSSFVDYYLGTDKAVFDIYRKLGMERQANQMWNKVVEYYSGG